MLIQNEQQMLRSGTSGNITVASMPVEHQVEIGTGIVIPELDVGACRPQEGLFGLREWEQAGLGLQCNAPGLPVISRPTSARQAVLMLSHAMTHGLTFPDPHGCAISAGTEVQC